MQIGEAQVIEIFKPKLVAGLFVASKLDPFKRHVASLQEIAYRVSLRRPTLPINADSGRSLHNQLQSAGTNELSPVRNLPPKWQNRMTK